MSTEDKAKLVRNRAGPDDYTELDYDLVKPAPAAKRRAVARGGAGAHDGSKLSAIAERPMERDT